MPTFGATASDMPVRERVCAALAFHSIFPEHHRAEPAGLHHSDLWLTSLTSSAVAVVLSHGKNGYGATKAADTQAARPAATKWKTTTTTAIFVSRIMTSQARRRGI